MSSPVYPHNHDAGAGPSSSRSSRNHYYRPATIAELAAQAQENLWDPTKGLKHWLRAAEKARRTGDQLVQAQDYEGAFVEYAKAATIVLEKLPTHREYEVLLNPDQRSNLGMNGQDILDNLSQLKPILIDRYEQWQASQLPTPGSSRASSTDPGLSREEIARRRREEQEEARAREAREAARREEIWRQEDFVRRQAEERERQLAWRNSGEGRREDLVLRRAAEARALTGPEREATAERQRRQDEQRRQQEEAARRDDDRARRRAAEERRRQEQEGIMRRQQESEAATRATRREIARQSPSPSAGPGPSYKLPDPDASSRAAMPQVYAPQPSRPPPPSHQSSFADPYGTGSVVPVMPLERPNKYEDDSSTDAESTEHGDSSRASRNDQTPKGKPLVPSSFPQPILTTTSPPPPELGSIKYPSLMSQHQLKQGYAPSLQSMFAKTHISEPPKPDGSLLFESKSSTPNGLQSNSQPPQTIPAPVIPPHPSTFYGPESHPPANSYSHQHSQSYSSTHKPSSNGTRASPYPSPAKEVASHRPNTSTSSAAARIVPGNWRDAHVRELRTIKLPRQCLPRFLSIARVNTLQNRETCGLLLGKDKGTKFVVTTLLIPKQHSTSDTCMMDEEELVMQFTEERHLITLGWIHTHPTQSCFMSSVDLHTHSGFQRMLPESFAVVCAPSSTPQFGIFRLTDPGGLQTILDCNAKEAFHPHPEVPIYTDCDNSHVQMRDLPLEIVDLR